MREKVFSNYFPFYEMVKLSLLLSNRKDGKPDKDIHKIIEFIGEAYQFDFNFILFCLTKITDELSAISVVDDINAFKSLSSTNNEALGDFPELLQIKCDALNEIIEETTKYDTKVNKNWFDYSYYRQYDAQARFAQLKATSTVGYIAANKLVGIMLATGVGCEKDLKEAILRFKQCVFWGDIPSIFLLAYALELDENKEQAIIYRELATLDSYFLKGVTVLPKKEEGKSQAVKDLYAEISSIKHDVIYQYNMKDINYSFVEVMMSTDISHLQKLEYINNFSNYEWKEVTNSSKTITKMGFNLGGK